MISRNSKTSVSHKLILNLSDKTNIKGSDKYVQGICQTLASTTHGKI